MTAFQSKTFSVAEGRSDVSEQERQEAWADTFGNSCEVCLRLGWAQTPSRNVKCGCGRVLCETHQWEHLFQAAPGETCPACHHQIRPDCEGCPDDARCVAEGRGPKNNPK